MSRNNRQQFTLIEVLMVIMILGILMGILLPTLNKAQEKAKITQARAEINSLATAIKMYESTYGYLPVAAGSDSSWGWQENGDTQSPDRYAELISILSQTGSYTSNGNTRKIRMLDVEQAGIYRDPWDSIYHIAWDGNYDGEIPAAAIPGMTQTAYKSVVVWSEGPDGKDKPEDSEFVAGFNGTSNSDDKNRDNIYSLDVNWHTGTGFKVD